MSRAVGVRPSSSPSLRSSPTSSSRVAKRRGTSPAARLAAFHEPKCSITVCGCTVVSGSVAKSLIVGDLRRRSAQARNSARICSSEYRLRIPAWNSASFPGSIAATAWKRGFWGMPIMVEQVRETASAGLRGANERRAVPRLHARQLTDDGVERQDPFERRDAPWAELRAGLVLDLPQRLVDRAGGAVVPRREHRVECAGDVDGAGPAR